MKKFIITLILLAFTIVRGQVLAPIASNATFVNFVYTGAIQSFTVPNTLCVSTVTFVVRGAKGGGGGGLGAAIQATYAVTAGQVFQIMVGGSGTQGAASGGFNGGGTGQVSSGSGSIPSYASYGGGGASDVRIAPFALANRILVAGGGGGAGGGSNSVCGGAANCNNGASGCNIYGSGGGGGTQIAGGTAGVPWAGTPPGGSAGTLGVGGQGGLWQTASGGGGGGGYYGGGGGGNDGCCPGANGGGGGGGGSSFYPAGSLCAPAAQNGNGSVTIYYLPGIKPTVIESYAMCSRSAPALNTFSLSAQITTAAAGVLTFSWTGPGGFNSVVNSTAVAVNPASTPTIGSYMTQTSPGAGTVITTQYLYSPNPSPLASGIYTVYAGSNGTVGACASTVQVMVNQTPTISVFNVNAPACQGTTLNFSLTPINPTVAVAGQSVIAAYSWLGPNSFASNTQSPSIVNSSTLNTGTYSGTAVYNYTQSLASTVFTTAPNTPLIFTSTLTCKKDTSLLAVIINTALPSSANYTLCPGGNLSLNTSISAQPTTFSWVGPAGYTSNVQSPSISNVTPINSGNYSLTALFTNPSTTLVCSQTAVSNLSVVVTSPVAVTLPNNICQNTTATLSASAPGAINFSWVGPNNFTSTTTNNSILNIQPIATGPYFATAMFAIGSVSCTTTGSNQISVVPVNTITVIPNITVCEPNGATLLASSQGAITYSWSGPASYTSNATNPQFINLYPVNSGIYTVTTSYNNGILTCYNTNTTNLTVNPILTFTLPTYKQVCFNSLVLVNGPAGATSYTWSGGNGFLSNTQNLQIPNIQAVNAGIYQLELNLGPCKTKASINIDVLDPIQFTLTPNSRTICLGDTVKLTMGSAFGSGNYAYVWDPQVYLSSPTGSFQVGTPAGTTIYNVTGFDIACPSYTLGYNFKITVNKPPMPNLQLDKTQGCEALCQFYNTKTQSEAAITTYDFGGDRKLQTDSFNYCLDAPGTYTLKIYSKGINGCSGTYQYPEPIVVFPKPHSDFSWTPEIVTTTDNTITFKPSSKYGPVVNTAWQFTGSTITGIDTTNVNSPQRTYENIGKYPILLISTTDKGCIDTVVKFLEVVDELNIFIPNSFTPNGDGLNDIFNIKGVGFKLENYNMEIFDRWGTSIYFTKDVMKGWDGTVKSGQPIADAVYIYKIKVIGANGQGKKEYVGHVTLIK